MYEILWELIVKYFQITVICITVNDRYPRLVSVSLISIPNSYLLCKDYDKKLNLVCE